MFIKFHFFNLSKIEEKNENLIFISLFSIVLRDVYIYIFMKTPLISDKLSPNIFPTYLELSCIYIHIFKIKSCKKNSFK